MKRNASVTNYCFTIICMFLSISFSANAQNGSLPFFRSFLDDDKKTEGIAFPGPNDPKITGLGEDRSNKAELKQNGMVLTNGMSEIGAFYLPNHNFSTKDGFSVEFEYMIFGPEGLSDGICFFMVDNLYMDSELLYGTQGAGFAYTGRYGDREYKSSTKGIKGAYLGIALDDGNFKNLRMEGQEMRNGIHYAEKNQETKYTKPAIYNTRSNVTIRGAAGRGDRDINQKGDDGKSEIITRQEGFWGYPVLITRHTGWSKENQLSDPGELRNTAAFQLVPGSGVFENTNNLIIDEPFRITGEKEFNSPDDVHYRKAIITLEKNPDESVGGFKITVAIQHHKTISVVIKDFTYPRTVTYMENSLVGSRSKGVPIPYKNYPAMVTYTTPTPENLLFGFAASTGDKNSKTHIIKNLRITSQYGANSANDDIRAHRRGPVTIRPFDNDLGYIDNNGVVEGNKDYLDPETFRFWTDEQTCKGSEYDITDPENKGKWVYDKKTMQVMFFPIRGFVGTAQIMYDVKGKHYPYSKEEFRSSLAHISVTVANTDTK